MFVKLIRKSSNLFLLFDSAFFKIEYDHGLQFLKKLYRPFLSEDRLSYVVAFSVLFEVFLPEI